MKLSADLSCRPEQSLLFPMLSLKAGSDSIVLRFLSPNHASSSSAETYDGIVTSPPYCNRYDYTHEPSTLSWLCLAKEEREVVQLRQEMLSCTVENRPRIC